MTSGPGPAQWQVPALGGWAYWRKNPFLAASMVPIVLTLAEGRFRAVDPGCATVFDAHVHEVSGRVGSLGTFKLTVRGRKFALVGPGSIGGMEDVGSPAQVQYLAGFDAHFPRTLEYPSALRDRSFGANAGRRMRLWRDMLSSAGARMS